VTKDYSYEGSASVHKLLCGGKLFKPRNLSRKFCKDNAVEEMKEPTESANITMESQKPLGD